jgi:DNA-directed RNA polymerase subunit RPC12/RpoP
MKSVPLCPKCGKLAEQIKRRVIRTGLFGSSDNDKRETIVTYRCKACGTEFAETESNARDAKAS